MKAFILLLALIALGLAQQTEWNVCSLTCQSDAGTCDTRRFSIEPSPACRPDNQNQASFQLECEFQDYNVDIDVSFNQAGDLDRQQEPIFTITDDLTGNNDLGIALAGQTLLAQCAGAAGVPVCPVPDQTCVDIQVADNTGGTPDINYIFAATVCRNTNCDDQSAASLLSVSLATLVGLVALLM